MTETSKVFVREASMVPVYSLLLFGGAIGVDHQRGLLTLDGWASFKAPARIAVLVSSCLEAPFFSCAVLIIKDFVVLMNL